MTGVGECFSRFRESYNIDSSVVSDIRYRYRRITRQLNRYYRDNDSPTANSIYVGSYGRDTAAAGLSDIDMIFSVPQHRFQMYNSYKYNGQSALLQDVRDALRETYPNSDISGDGQVVIVEFDDGLRFEVLPAFKIVNGRWRYPNTNKGGFWKICNPQAEIEAISHANQTSNKNLKLLCRMMRLWRNENHVDMSGHLIDTLACRFITGFKYKEESFWFHDYMIRDFFKFLSKQNSDQGWWKALGSGDPFFDDGNFCSKAKKSLMIVEEAIEYDRKKYFWTRNMTWRIIFGSKFPMLT